MAADIDPWTYHSDAAGIFMRGQADYLGVQVNGGGTPLLGGAPWTTGGEQAAIPRNIQPRVVRFVNAAGTKTRAIVVNDTTCDIWTGVATQITIQDGSGATALYTAYARTAERSRGRRLPG